MSNFENNFNKLSDSVGVVIAIATLESTLPQDFWESRSIEQLVIIYKNAYEYPHVRSLALAQLQKTPGNFKQWYKISISYGGDHKDLGILVFDKLIDLAQSFTEVSNAIFKFLTTDKDPNTAQIANQKMLSLAQTFDDWYLVCICSRCNPEQLKFALEKMIEFSKTSNDLLRINYVNPNPETLNSAVISIDSDPGDPIEKWSEIHQKLSISKDLKKIALQKIIKFATPEF